jgi:glutamine phosphoribosylpyrophosphate amidotransferase
VIRNDEEESKKSPVIDVRKFTSLGEEQWQA